MISCRHHKNKQAANELLTKLKDNRELQHFLQDGQEVIFLPLKYIKDFFL